MTNHEATSSFQYFWCLAVALEISWIVSMRLEILSWMCCRDCPCTCTGKASKENPMRLLAYRGTTELYQNNRCKVIIIKISHFLRQHRGFGTVSRRSQWKAPGHILHVPFDQIFCRSVVVLLEQNQDQGGIWCCRHSWEEVRSS